jgi:hypothetical protein
MALASFGAAADCWGFWLFGFTKKSNVLIETVVTRHLIIPGTSHPIIPK